MNGQDYIAVVTIYNKAGAAVAEAGKDCRDVAPQSLPWLLEKGHIVPGTVEPAAAPTRRKRREVPTADDPGSGDAPSAASAEAGSE